MGPSAAEQLRELNWASITSGLHHLAASWARLCVDHLPLKDRTLESLRLDYRDLLEAMPLSSSTEIETALRQFTRGLRLKGDAVTATQDKYLQDYCVRRRYGHLGSSAPPTATTDGSYEYLEPLVNGPHAPAKAITVGALYYVSAHRNLGTLFPTFTDELRDRLFEPTAQRGLIDARGFIMLEGIISAHSRWIAELVGRTKAEPVVLAKDDRPDYGDGVDEQDAGSWLDDFLEEEAENDESGWSPVLVHQRQHK